MALPDPVAPLESVTPLPAVHPLAFILHAEPMPLPLGPVALVGIPAGPGVRADYLEAVRPRAGVLALALGSGADAVSVGFAILPPPAVSAAVVEVKPSARHSDTHTLGVVGGERKINRAGGEPLADLGGFSRTEGVREGGIQDRRWRGWKGEPSTHGDDYRDGVEKTKIGG